MESKVTTCISWSEEHQDAWLSQKAYWGSFLSAQEKLLRSLRSAKTSILTFESTPSILNLEHLDKMLDQLMVVFEDFTLKFEIVKLEKLLSENKQSFRKYKHLCNAVIEALPKDQIYLQSADGETIEINQHLLRKNNTIFDKLLKGDSTIQNIPMKFPASVIREYTNFLTEGYEPECDCAIKMEQMVEMCVKYDMKDMFQIMLEKKLESNFSLSQKCATMITEMLKECPCQLKTEWKNSQLRKSCIKGIQQRILKRKREAMEQIENDAKRRLVEDIRGI